MRIAVTSVQVPYIHGGAEVHVRGLEAALRRAGHEVELIQMPFRFSPIASVRRSMDVWESEELGDYNGYRIERVICMKFPTFYAQHDNKVAWVMHQHRVVYDLWETPHADGLRGTKEGEAFRREIIERDQRGLAGCKRLFANSRNVAERLRRYNGIRSEPLYHPPQRAELFYCEPAQPYVFFPSRFETLKRQSLLIEAMALVRAPVVALLSGEGGQLQQARELVAKKGLHERVRLLGRISDDQLLAYYAHALGVFYGPFDEDYGYVTLEAMLAHKPVITCKDSGGPLELVVDGETGLVAEPKADAVAAAIDRLWADRARAARMGKAGRARFDELEISWDHVVEALLS